MFNIYKTCTVKVGAHASESSGKEQRRMRQMLGVHRVIKPMLTFPQQVWTPPFLPAPFHRVMLDPEISFVQNPLSPDASARF